MERRIFIEHGSSTRNPVPFRNDGGIGQSERAYVREHTSSSGRKRITPARHFASVKPFNHSSPRKCKTRNACFHTRRIIGILLTLSVLAGGPRSAAAQQNEPGPNSSSVPLDNPVAIPDLGRVLPPASDAKGVTATIRILVLLTVLTLIPSILVMTTAFPRIIIVLALLRQAVGVPQLPPGQVLLALSLFMTVLIMAPVWQKIHSAALAPYLEGSLPQAAAFDIAAANLKDFMYRQIEQAGNDEDVLLFLQYAQNRQIEPNEQVDVDAVPLTVMIPAFMLSELKTAFIMGFRIYLPFLVIDMVIAAILLSMGMLMLPPVLISLPFKLLLFVLADGWHLVIETLLYSFAQT